MESTKRPPAAAGLGMTESSLELSLLPPHKRPRLIASPSTASSTTLEDPAATLSSECAAYVATLTTSEQLASMTQLVKIAVTTVERVVQQKPQWRDATCEPFGSSVTTLGTTNSDVDMSINLPGYGGDGGDVGKRRKVEQKLVKQLAGLMRRDSSFVTTKAVPEARVPIVRSVLAVGGLQCDLSICNELAVLNSKLLRAYLLADPRVRPLALLVRASGAARGIMSPRTGGLTSYAMLLLLLSYLQQQVHPPILPKLQPPPLDCVNSDAATVKDNGISGPDEIVDPETKMRKVQGDQAQQKQQQQAGRHFVRGFDCTFSSSPPDDWEPASETEHSVGTLLHGFFDFYGNQFGRPTSSESGFTYRLLQLDEQQAHRQGEQSGPAEPTDQNDSNVTRSHDDVNPAENGRSDDQSLGVLPPIVSLRMGRSVQRAEKDYWTEPRWLSVEVSDTDCQLCSFTHRLAGRCDRLFCLLTSSLLMCLQDPFEVNRNVANTLRMDMERRLLTEFRRAARITSYESTSRTGRNAVDSRSPEVKAATNETGHGDTGREGVLGYLLSRA